MSAAEVNRQVGYIASLLVRLETAGFKPDSVLLPASFDARRQVLPLGEQILTLLGYPVIWTMDVDSPRVVLKPGPP